VRVVGFQATITLASPDQLTITYAQSGVTQAGVTSNEIDGIATSIMGGLGVTPSSNTATATAPCMGLPDIWWQCDITVAFALILGGTVDAGVLLYEIEDVRGQRTARARARV
jgi:hypothetical protein